jgi:phage shock protein PspC (stress-responsive transcriptional regulator)
METTEIIHEEPKRLTRPQEGRWLGGVCAALARYFDLNPLIYRIAFAALALAGGTGILLYAAAWLVIPEEGTEDSIASEAIKNHRDRPGMLVGIGLLGFGAILWLSSVHWWPSPGNLWLAAALGGAAIVWWQTRGRDRAAAPGEAAPRRRSFGPPAAALLIAGFGAVAIIDAATGASIDWRFVFGAAAVALGALVAGGIAMGRPIGAVVALGFVVLALLAVSAIVRVPLFAGVGDRAVHPATLTSVHDRYRLGIGNLDVNLSDVRFPTGETHVKATLGVGDLTIRVPQDVTVEVDARASAGQVTLFGHANDGTSVHDRATRAGATPGRVLVLDARVGLGQVEVVRG